jgi:hypothetical protein
MDPDIPSIYIERFLVVALNPRRRPERETRGTGSWIELTSKGACTARQGFKLLESSVGIKSNR